VLLIIGLFVRLKVAESPVFAELAERGAQARVPALMALRKQTWTILRVTGMHLIVTTLAFTATAFVLAYGIARVGFPRTEMLQVVCVAVLVAIALNPIFGRAGDIVGRRPVYLAGAAAAIVLAFPAFWALNTGTFVGGVGGILGLVLPSMAMYTTQGAWFPELFPAQFRVTGAGLGVQLATVALGGPAPTIAQALLRASHGRSWSVSTYLCGVALVSLFFALLSQETSPARAGGADRR
jgi:MFS family permease